ncbi:MAG: hypothetical protein JWL70_2355, partial [Acidimicrobiia bacterium]|nr:hypothetical protein [Acidimicrobiia bacterium]
MAESGTFRGVTVVVRPVDAVEIATIIG